MKWFVSIPLVALWVAISSTLFPAEAIVKIDPELEIVARLYLELSDIQSNTEVGREARIELSKSREAIGELESVQARNQVAMARVLERRELKKKEIQSERSWSQREQLISELENLNKERDSLASSIATSQANLEKLRESVATLSSAIPKEMLIELREKSKKLLESLNGMAEQGYITGLPSEPGMQRNLELLGRQASGLLLDLQDVRSAKTKRPRIEILIELCVNYFAAIHQIHKELKWGLAMSNQLVEAGLAAFTAGGVLFGLSLDLENLLPERIFYGGFFGFLGGAISLSALARSLTVGSLVDWRERRLAKKNLAIYFGEIKREIAISSDRSARDHLLKVLAPHLDQLNQEVLALDCAGELSAQTESNVSAIKHR